MNSRRKEPWGRSKLVMLAVAFAFLLLAAVLVGVFAFGPSFSAASHAEYSGDVAVLWRNSVTPAGDEVAVLWRNAPVQLDEKVAVLWRNSIVPAEGEVAVLWRNSVTPAGDEVAVLWRNSALV